jgi:hypothetical protein
VALVATQGAVSAPGAVNLSRTIVNVPMIPSIAVMTPSRSAKSVGYL